jgi:hypothetical protein
MVFLLEEIIVEAAMVIATVVATACLLIVLAGFALQRRALRRGAPAARLVVLAQDARVSDRAAHRVSTLTPSPH